MKQFAIIGLDYFGKRVLDELLELDAELLIIDKDRDLIDAYRDQPVEAVALDVLNEENLRRVLPEKLDAVIIDLGANIEASILTTSYCRKFGIPGIVVKAETEAHAEILKLVGATRVVFPNREAAKRIVPVLAAPSLLNYLPVSGKLAIAELELPSALVGLTLVEADLRKRHGLNLIAVKNGEGDEYQNPEPTYRFRSDDVALVSGADAALYSFGGSALKVRQRRNGIRGLRKLFGLGSKK